MSDINRKINKYQLKLKSTTNQAKAKKYNDRIQYYQSLIKTGGNIDFESEKNKAMEALKHMQATVKGNDVSNQMKELIAKSEKAQKNFDEVSDSYKKVGTNFLEFTTNVQNFASKGVEVDSPVNVDDLNKISTNMETMLTGIEALDQKILESIKKEIGEGKPVSEEEKQLVQTGGKRGYK